MVKNLNVLFAGMLLLLFAFAIPNPAWAPWVTLEDYSGSWLKPIKNTEGAKGLAFCLDSNGFPHIAWIEEHQFGRREIYYLKWNGSSWVDVDGSGQESIKVPDIGLVTSSFSLCLDFVGNPRIAWDKGWGEEEDDYILLVSEVYYLWWNGSEWVDADGVGRESIKVGTGYEYCYPSLCLDSDGHPHLLMVKEYASFLCKPHICYLWWNGSQWVETRGPGQKGGDVCDISKMPESLSLRLDSNDQPHMVVASEEENGVRIRYLYWNANNNLWGRRFIKYTDPGRCHVPSLCLDSKNRPHIAFCFEAESSGFSPHRDIDIYYLWWNGSAWVDADGAGQESENISNDEDICVFPSLCLDSRGYPHVAWLNKDEGEIRYLHWDGNKWVDPDVSAWPELVRLLKDKWKENQWWTPEVLAHVQEAVEAQEFRTSIGESAKSPFLCLDSKGRPCIAWIDGTYGGGICYAKWVSAKHYRDEYNYYIRGYVGDENGRPVSGVKVTLSSDICCGAYTTSNDGHYEFIYLPIGDYTVTPHKSGCSFNPEQYEYSMLDSNKDKQNFEMRPL